MPSPVRFVHCAGFRFDSRSWEGPVSWVGMRDQDLWQTFEAVLALCRAEKTHFLFLAGDLFEQEYVSRQTVERVAKSLAKLDGTRIFIVPGERDPLIITSAYRLSEWPDNVHIFSGGLSKVEIPSLKVTVYGSGWTTYRQQNAFLDDFLTTGDGEQIQFMLLHAEVDSVQNTEGFIPLQQEQIAASGLTYLALGHKQKWSGLQQAGETYWADCGSPEARSFRESWPHGVILGETDGISTRIKFLELGQRRYIEKTLSLQAGEMEDIVAKLLAETTSQEREKDLFRLKLTESFPKAEAAVQSLPKLLADKFCYIEIVLPENKSTSQLGTDVALTQVFVNEIHTRLAAINKTEEQSHWELVKKIGLSALGQGREDETSSLQQSEQIIWPERNDNDFFRLVRNLRQVGDEELSLPKVRDSLARAKERTEEQRDSMGQIKDEYEALRRDWEAENNRQEEERLLQIGIKNLQAKKNHLAERIAGTTKIQERLALYRQNPDYRELRRIQAELDRVEELCRETEAGLSGYTHDPQVDWAMIESLREECLEWACLEEEAERLAFEAQQLAQKVSRTQNFLQTSGYQGLPEDKDQHLRLAEEERDAAQAELEKLTVLSNEIEKAEKACSEEIAKLRDFAVIAGATAADEQKIMQTLRRLAKWRSLKISGFFDWILREQFGWATISERLSSRLNRCLNKYNAADYDGFKRQQKEFHNQQQLAENLQAELARLRKEEEREKEFRRIVHSRNHLLNQAYRTVKAADLSDWLNGWEDYRQKKSQVVEMIDELHLKMEQQQAEEKKLTACVEQLRQKLRHWESPVSDPDEVLAIVMRVARQLRAKEEAAKEYTFLQQTYAALLDNRNIEQLARTLEPLADLERESCLSDEERQATIISCRQKLTETLSQLAKAEKSLQHSRTTPVIPDLDKKLERKKLQWKTYEELQRALAVTQELLETSLQKWQAKYGKALEAKAQWIFNRTFSSPASLKKENIMAEAKRYYFSYRMALAQLALDDRPETPLSFFIGEMKETEVFWEDVLAYLDELSLSRPVSFKTSDTKLQQLVISKGYFQKGL